MKLYEVPNNTKIRVLKVDKVPPGAPNIGDGEVLMFRNIDGMYSYCLNEAGDVVHLAAWAEVEIVE